MATIVVFGTLDTKGAVHQFLVETIRAMGNSVLLVDASLRTNPQSPADVQRETVLKAAGIESIGGLGKTQAAAKMGEALSVFLRNLALEGRLDGVVSVGGRCGMLLAVAAVRALPLGTPCVLATHVPEEASASLNGAKDVAWMRCLIKPGMLNRIVRPFLTRAAGAICGMVEFGTVARWMANRPLIVASHMGHSRGSFERARYILERAGYDLVAFTHKGSGGRAMESAITSGAAVGVLDLSTTEVADELLGGISSAGPARLEGAGRRGLPAVIAPGGLDAVNTSAPLPRGFRGRHTVRQGDNELLVRTTAAECRELGKILAQRANKYLGPVTICLPVKGLSKLGGPGQIFHDPEADRALFESLKAHLRKSIRVVSVQTTAAEAPFAEACALALLQNIKRRDRDRNILRQLEFLKDASEVVLLEAARLLEPLTFSEGEWVQPDKGEPDGLYCVADGFVEVIDGEEGVEVIGPGGFFGEDELIFGRRGPIKLRALEQCDVLFLGSKEFEALSVHHQELEEALAVFLKSKQQP